MNFYEFHFLRFFFIIRIKKYLEIFCVLKSLDEPLIKHRCLLSSNQPHLIIINRIFRFKFMRISINLSLFLLQYSLQMKIPKDKILIRLQLISISLINIRFYYIRFTLILFQSINFKKG